MRHSLPAQRRWQSTLLALVGLLATESGTGTVFSGASTGILSAAEPQTAVVLDLPGSGTDPLAIDYAALPTLSGEHVVVRSARLGPYAEPGQPYDMHHLKLQLHSYLTWYDGRFHAIWSEGPRIEDEPTQEVRHATSLDGLTWSESRSVTGQPPEPYAFIARGLWEREGELLALAAHFKGKGAFGADKELELRAYAWQPADQRWVFRGRLYDNAINNFPPQKLPDGNWIVTRRDARFNVSMLIGGRSALDDWQNFPVVGIQEVSGFRPDEPIFWPLDDGSLFALYRDNGGSQRLYHSMSHDAGRTWTRPVLTNFPNATSKVFSMRTSRGHRLLVSNANPKWNRRELHLSVSTDDQRFTRMVRLDIPTPPTVGEATRIAAKFRSGVASLQYPHLIEHDGHLLLILSRSKTQIETFRFPLAAIDQLIAVQR